MQLTWSAEEKAFRAEVRAYLERELTPDLREVGRNLTSVYAPTEASLSWQRILHRRGWAAPAWPVDWGGCGWDLPRRYIFAEELAAAGAPPLSPMGLGMCGPVLLAYGTRQQKERFLPPMLAGDELWCQGYSEPGSGSDLASLRMTARSEGDDWVCDGHKVWTTHAHDADWIFCLVRTSTEDVRQKGITFLLIDMASPGIEVRPILSISGEHIQNEIFFSDVRVPRRNTVGAVGAGWTVTKYLMEFERGGTVGAPAMATRLQATEKLARNPAGAAGERPIASPGLRARLALARIDIETLAQVELRVMLGVASGAGAGPAASMLKTVATELSQRLTELALEASGHYAAPWQPQSVFAGGPSPAFSFDFEPVGPPQIYANVSKYFNDRAGSIYAGTNEIQRNIIARLTLQI